MVEPADPLRYALDRGWITPAQADEASRATASAASGERTLIDSRSAAIPAASPDLPDDVRASAADPAKRFGRFILVRELGRGGFGAVHLAWQSDLGRYVALKFLQSDDAEDVARFLREARTAASLAHANIVPIHEVGVEGARHYIAMAFVRGTTLARLRLEARQAATILRDAARAVEFAHGRGIVHRDLKPHNLMLDDAGRAWVLDFGLARSVSAGSSLTAPGGVVGTPAYMPPEQARGEPCDARSDVYSLGATLYEVVTGAPPFAGPALEVLHRVVFTDPPTPHALAPRVDRELETIILKAMDKDPAQRYAGAGAFADDLDRWLAGEPVLARPPSMARRAVKWIKRRPALAATLALLALAVLGISGFLLGPARAVIATPSGPETRTFWPAGRTLLTWSSPDYDPQQQEVDLQPWRAVTWTPPAILNHGFLEVQSEPTAAGVVVVIDDATRIAGRSGERLRVPKGRHEVIVTAPDHEPLSRTVSIPPGDTVAHVCALVHEVGWLVVTGEPDGIMMTIDGAAHALPQNALAVPTGEYTIEFTKANHFSATRRVRVPKASAPAPAGGEFWSRPAGPVYLHATLEPMERWSVLGEFPFALETADLDEDGVLDVLALGDGVLVARSGLDGSVLWRMAATSFAGLAIGDLDLDGVPDVATCVEVDRAKAAGNVVAWSGRDGRKLWSVAAFGRPVRMADVDADGVPDVVVAGEYQPFRVLSGRDGRELWSVPNQDMSSVRGLIDVDADGVLDLIAWTKVWGGQPHEWLSAYSGRDGRRIWRIDADVHARSSVAAVPRPSKTPLVLTSNGARLAARDGATADPVWVLPNVNAAIGFAVTDLDADGIPDVVLGDYEGRVVAVDAAGRERWRTPLGEDAVGDPVLVDVDHDGAIDVVVGTTAGSIVAVRGADGGILWRYRGSNVMRDLHSLGDIDGDGAPEILYSESSGRLTVIAARPASLRWRASLAASTMWRTVQDVDGDELPDAIVNLADGRTVIVSGADGSLLKSIRTGLQDAVGGVADVDRDGVPDFICRETARSGRDGRILWRADGQPPIWEPTMVDVDRDGVLDAVLVCNNGFVRAVSGVDGHELWIVRVPGAVMWSALDVDLDHDGARELLVPSMAACVVVLDARRGTIRFRTESLGAAVERAAAVPDQDGDGVDEIAAGGQEGHVACFSGRTGRLRWRAPGLGSLCRGVTSPGDIDGDGIADVIAASGPVKAHSGKDGRLLWSAELNTVTVDGGPVDLDGDGIGDVVTSGWRGTHFTSGRDGRPLLWMPSHGVEHVRGRGFYVVHGTSLELHALRPRRLSMRQLAQSRAWASLGPATDAALRAGESASARHLRGLARLRLGDAAGALDEFDRAAKAGLKSPELEADTIEALLRAGRSLPTVPPGPEAVALLLAPDRLTADQRKVLAAAHVGEAPHLLLLAARYDDALRALPPGETTDLVALCLRALAKWGKGEVQPALYDLRRALVLWPAHRLSLHLHDVISAR